MDEGKKTDAGEWPPFDLDRLGLEERQLWDERFFEPPGPESNAGPDSRIMEFGSICILTLQGVPGVVSEYLNKTKLPGRVAEHRRNIMEARYRGLIRPESEADPD